MKEKGGDFILRRYSGGISFQKTSPVENYADKLMLTWNPGRTYLNSWILGCIYPKVGKC
jgi:hypothetical protein